jgi:hypothetical protein
MLFTFSMYVILFHYILSSFSDNRHGKIRVEVFLGGSKLKRTIEEGEFFCLRRRIVPTIYCVFNDWNVLYLILIQICDFIWML